VRRVVPGELLVDAPADGVVRLTLSHPGKANALDRALLDALAEAVAALDARCAILTGAGDVFSAGYALDASRADFADEAERFVAHPFTAALDALDATDVPTLAVLPGPAIGGGLELALACDLRLAAAGARLGMPPAKLGLVYSHVGLRRFLDVIGAPRTRELFLLGAPIDAETALGWGLVNRVVAGEALEAEALGLARELAGNAPLALRATKRALRTLLAAQGELDPGVEASLVELRRAGFRSEDFAEGVRAFAAKRAPRWRGR
jgi:enoyl-CoA hydratase/carnithine racemase